uniref:Uncharacterized protein n=1 Tax=Cacopsylla melanoneura TaxID=428564 RepID=A0A8D8S640_9HEMI
MVKPVHTGQTDYAEISGDVHKYGTHVFLDQMWHDVDQLVIERLGEVLIPLSVKPVDNFRMIVMDHVVVVGVSLDRLIQCLVRESIALLDQCVDNVLQCRRLLAVSGGQMMFELSDKHRIRLDVRVPSLSAGEMFSEEMLSEEMVSDIGMNPV